MKNEKLFSGIWGAILAFLLGFGSVMCMVTAFDMGVDTFALGVCCVLTAVVCCVCYTLPLGLVPVGIGAVILGYLWKNGSLLLSLEALLNRLSRQYNRAYSWGIIRWGLRTADEMEPTMLLMLCIMAVLIIMAVSRSVCRGKTVLPGVALSVLCAGTCFVVTDTVPHVFWLFAVLLAVIVLVLTGRVRHQDPMQGNWLSCYVMPIAAAALLLLLILVPQKTYNGQATAKRLAELVLKPEQLQILTGQNGIIMQGGNSQGVDLTTVGNRVESDALIMEVEADFDGVLYLRSRAMNTYDGTGWKNEEKESLSLWKLLTWPNEQLYNLGIVQIKTKYAHGMLYTPYYIDAAQMRDISEGMPNDAKMTEYSFRYLTLRDPDYFFRLYPTENTAAAGWDSGSLSQFITLPEHVRKWAVPLASEITGNVVSPYHKAQKIANYVRSSAVYNTQTGRMPAGEKDFSQWFLEESNTGYCIHFASAAAVLLQASGIPARYVTGYMTPVQAGQTVQVQAKLSHAWVEYWLPGFGWTVLEATPEDLSQPGTETTEETTAPQTEETLPGVTLPAGQDETYNSGLGKVLWVILSVIAGVAALIALLWGQRSLRIRFRERRVNFASPNTQALLRWQETVRLARLLEQLPDEELFTLAQKAKYSNHKITWEELKLFDAYAQNAREQLKKQSFTKRLYYRFILAIY